MTPIQYAGSIRMLRRRHKSEIFENFSTGVRLQAEYGDGQRECSERKLPEGTQFVGK